MANFVRPQSLPDYNAMCNQFCCAHRHARSCKKYREETDGFPEQPDENAADYKALVNENQELMAVVEAARRVDGLHHITCDRLPIRDGDCRCHALALSAALAALDSAVPQ